MKYTYLSILTCMIILILILLFFIILTIINNNNKTIETFIVPEIVYPIINYANIRTIPLSRSSSFYGIYVAKAEQFEESSKKDDIIYAFSSFNVTGNSKLLSVLNNSNITNPPIILTPSTNEGLDYIYYDLPEDTNEKYLLKYIKITYDIGDARSLNETEENYYKDLFDLTSVNFFNPNPFSVAEKLNAEREVTMHQFQGKLKVIVLYDFNTNARPVLYSNIALVTNIKLNSKTTPIKIVSIILTFNNNVDGDYYLDDSQTNMVNMISQNETEAIPFPVIPIADTEDDSNIILAYKYYKILKLKIPWAIYDPVITNTGGVANRVKDALGRGVRDGSITGTSHSIMRDDNNVNYLNGTVETQIQFPYGSFMFESGFTCCSITKYTTTQNRKFILSTNDLAIGHYEGIEGIIKPTNLSVQFQWPNTPPPPNRDEDTNWVITCFKSRANKEETIKNKSIIINDNKIDTLINFTGKYDVPSSLTFPSSSRKNCHAGLFERLPLQMTTRYNTDIVPEATCNDAFNAISPHIYGYRLGINTFNNRPDLYSDFGFAYMLVWDCILTDNELLIISKVLNNYVNNPTATIPSIDVGLTIFDGSTKEKAAKSALDIKQLTDTNTNGLYWIQPNDKSEAVQIFCIMDSNCNGGGWMLAMEAAVNSTTFNYNSRHWTEPTTIPRLNNTYIEAGTNYMTTNQDAKYAIFNNYLVKDCLAIFDSREFPSSLSSDEKYTDAAYPQYGKRWFEPQFNKNTPITLLNFFISNTRVFTYTYSQSSETILSKIRELINNTGTYLDYSAFMSKYITNKTSPYFNKIWSNQAAYLSYGFNNYVMSEKTDHRVRWGGIFNENTEPYAFRVIPEQIIYERHRRWGYILRNWDNSPKIKRRIPARTEGNTEYPYAPNSVDVSGGIGLYNKSAGDIANCCHRDLGVNKSLSFKWFIR